MCPIPKAIRRGAAERIATTMQSQAQVEDAIRSGRPLDAEDDPERKLNYIQQKLAVSRGIARRIAAYEDPKILPLTPAQRTGAESLQGGTVDFISVSFLDVGRAASRAVARVAYPDRSPVGTGFMVAPGLFLTNHHVIGSPADAMETYLEFDYEEDPNLRKLPVTRFHLRPERLFIFDDTEDLDFALVAVGDRVDGPGGLDSFGYLPLLEGDDKHIKAIFVNVIQHPRGRPKELVTRENRILARTPNTLIYGADTLQGSSGAPVFNDDWEVLALHHWGSPSRAKLDIAEDGLPTSGNEGIRISSIVKHLRDELHRLSPDRRRLVEEAITPQFRRPSLIMRSAPPHWSPEAMTQPSREDESPQVHTNTDGTATWTVPIVVSVRIGGGVPAAGSQAHAGPPVPPPTLPSEEASVAGSEKFEPDTNYGSRRGYNPSFLGVKVPLPQLTEQTRKVAARNVLATGNEDPYEVKYQHFSLVMNGKRRLALYTAVNIDGASVVNINRKTGKVTRVEQDEDGEGAEAYEKWYDDPRIEAQKRTDQSLYSHPELKDFQRGHLVKRTDPSWGTVERAFRGQADTFHFTNCAPQHEKFNPVASRWAGLEDWITDESDDADMRVTVFTGPVFGSDDPKRGYVQVPLHFWKIVVRVQDGELLATAAIADQTELVVGTGEGAEDLSTLPAKLVLVKQVPVSKIEELTGLDFGELREHDTLEGGDGAEENGGGAERADGRGAERLIRSNRDYQIRRARDAR